MIATVVFTLDRNARRGNAQETASQLTSATRIAASAYSAIRANLRTEAGRLAASLPLQRAVVSNDVERMRRLAATRHARIVVDGRAIGALARQPRIAATGTISDGSHILARVTISIPLGDPLLALLQNSTPLPDHAVLLLVRGGRVLAGGPVGAPAPVRHGELTLRSIAFAASSAPLGARGTSIVAVEPVSAVEARIAPYRRRLLLAAVLTLAIAAALATRLGRPMARVLAEVARLKRQAQTDALTGLANRRALDERLDDELERARRNGTSMALVIADIDNFKQVNDTHGHQTGDEVLKAVARVFEETVRELDLPARFGGEEIAVVLPGTQLAGARRLAERIRSGVEATEIGGPDGVSLRVTASFGAAAFPTYADVAALVAAADAALYEAKRDGKNRVATATVRKKTVAAQPAAARA